MDTPAGIPKRHLILLLGLKGLGEAALGIRLGVELKQAGDQVFCLAHDSNSKLLEGILPFTTFGTAAAPLFSLYLSNCLAGFKPDSIILSDYFTTTLFFELFGLDPAMLTIPGIPVFAIDTWDSARTSSSIDVLLTDIRTVALWPDKVKSICPVPFLAPQDGERFYRSLPSKVTVTKRIRRHLHHALGMNDNAKGVLFCTAAWQHPNYDSHADAARRCAASVPVLIAEYLARMGNDVHLVHVGPQRYDLEQALKGRYHWLPQLPPSDFDQLLASMDLVLSANLSAVTIAKAMVFEVPILAVVNSVSASTPEEAEAACSTAPSPQLAKWLRTAMPLFPFVLWPIGYHRYLAPVLKDNLYMTALDAVELLDEQRIETALSALLFNKGARDGQAHRQASYLSQVRSLPSGPEVIRAAMA
jgi:Family of unknown function (DUF6365)